MEMILRGDDRGVIGPAGSVRGDDHIAAIHGHGIGDIHGVAKISGHPIGPVVRIQRGFVEFITPHQIITGRRGGRGAGEAHAKKQRQDGRQTNVPNRALPPIPTERTKQSSHRFKI